MKQNKSDTKPVDGSVSEAFTRLGKAVGKYFKDEPKSVDGSALLTTSTSLSTSELRETARDLQCETAKEAEMYACSKCEAIGLKDHCSTRLTADQIIALYGERIQQAKAEERERVLGIAEQRVEVLQKLLACYRVGKHPTEKLLTEVDNTKESWHSLKQGE